MTDETAVPDSDLWVHRTSASTVAVRRGLRTVLALIDDGEVQRIAKELFAIVQEAPEPDTMLTYAELSNHFNEMEAELATVEAALAALREQVAGQQSILDEIRMIPCWFDPKAQVGGYDVDGNEWNLIHALLLSAPSAALQQEREKARADGIEAAAMVVDNSRQTLADRISKLSAELNEDEAADAEEAVAMLHRIARAIRSIDGPLPPEIVFHTAKPEAASHE